MIVRAFADGDLERIELQEAQAGALAAYSHVNLVELSEQGLAFTMEHSGAVVAIGGLCPQWTGRAILWGLLSKHSGAHFPAIHREVHRKLIRCKITRIEATCDVGFKQGHRWLKMLGFNVEGHMAAYRPDGGDQILYSRVRR